MQRVHPRQKGILAENRPLFTGWKATGIPRSPAERSGCNPMPWENIEAIIGRAIVDATFRQQLLMDTQAAIRQSKITAEEEAILADIHATTLDDFARQVLQRMGKHEKEG